MFVEYVILIHVFQFYMMLTKNKQDSNIFAWRKFLVWVEPPTNLGSADQSEPTLVAPTGVTQTQGCLQSYTTNKNNENNNNK